MSPSPVVDVVVIGAGTAGLAAYRCLKEQGVRVAVIDHGPLGTLCARVGCMPSKAMLHAGERWTTADGIARWNTRQSAAARSMLWSGVGAIRDELAGGTAKSTRKKLGRDLVTGSARFVARDAIVVAGRRIEARAFVVASGSKAAVPDEIAALGDGVVTTDTLFDLPALPRSMGVIGLGNIGIEIGLALARLGVRVVAVGDKPRVAGIVDPLVGRRAVDIFSTEMTMSVGSEADVTRRGRGFRIRTKDGDHVVEQVLAALGRRPDLEALQLAEAGCELDDKGRPALDPATLRATGSRVFLAGDAAGLHPLQHEAVDDGRIAAEGAIALLAGRRLPKPARRTPLDIVFSGPDVFRVGKTLDALKDTTIVTATAEGKTNGRSKIVGAESNLIRLYARASTGELLGAEGVSHDGEHLAHILALAIGQKLTTRALATMPFYHPTVEETLQNALDHLTTRCGQAR